MAIIDGVPGVEVTIWIGGRPALEYADPEHGQEVPLHEPKVSSKYIECRSGEEFSIHLRVNDNYDLQHPMPHTLNLAAYIDGQWVRGELCRQEHLRNGMFRADIKERISQAPVNGAFIKQTFKFAGLRTVDDASNWRVENEKEMVRNLGVIELKVFRVQELGHSDFKPENNVPGLTEVAEKSLKGRAISHGTQFGEDVHEPAGAELRYQTVKQLPDDSGPIAVYKFFYRSREGLVHEAVITREQSDALSKVKPRVVFRVVNRREGTLPRQVTPVAAGPSPTPNPSPGTLAASIAPVATVAPATPATPATPAPAAVAAAPTEAERTQERIRQTAVDRLRELGVDVGHRERARALGHAPAPAPTRGQRPRAEAKKEGAQETKPPKKEKDEQKKMPPKKEDEDEKKPPKVEEEERKPLLGKRKIEEVDLTSD